MSPSGAAGRKWVRFGAKTTVFSALAVGPVWALGWWHVHRLGGGLETLGLAIMYGLVMVALSVIALVGLMVMLVGALRARHAGRAATRPASPGPPV